MRPINPRLTFKTTQTVTATTLTNAGSEHVCGPNKHERMLLEVKNAGSAALSDFALLVKAHEDSDYVSVLTGSAWNSPGADKILEWISGRIDTTASGATHVASIRLNGAYAFKFQAAVASSSAAITIRGSLA